MAGGATQAGREQGANPPRNCDQGLGRQPALRVCQQRHGDRVWTRLPSPQTQAPKAQVNWIKKTHCVGVNLANFIFAQVEVEIAFGRQSKASWRDQEATRVWPDRHRGNEHRPVERNRLQGGWNQRKGSQDEVIAQLQTSTAFTKEIKQVNYLVTDIGKNIFYTQNCRLWSNLLKWLVHLKKSTIRKLKNE